MDSEFLQGERVVLLNKRGNVIPRSHCQVFRDEGEHIQVLHAPFIPDITVRTYRYSMLATVKREFVMRDRREPSVL